MNVTPQKRAVLAAGAGACLWLLSACQPELPIAGEPTTSEEWVQASARAHDPEGHWLLFAAELTVGSFNEEGRFSWQEDLYVDLAADTFSRAIIIEGYLLEQSISPDGTCRNSWPHPSPTENQRRRLGLIGDPCLAVVPSRDFHEFLTGLPMSALGTRTRFSGSPTSETLDGQQVTAVTLTFDDDPNGQQWYLYIDPDTKLLLAARFDFVDGRGEWIYYTDLIDFGELRLAMTRRITTYPADQFVVEQRVLYEAVP